MISAPKALFVLAAALAVAQVRAAAVEEEDGVLVLDDDNFDEVVKSQPSLLVEFYAPWCGHCKRLAPEFAKAAQALKADGLKIAKLDATVNKEAASRFGIQGFPTLKFFRGDVSSPGEYNGPREADGIVNWVRKKSGPATQHVATVEDAAAFEKKNAVVVFGFVAPGSAAEKTFNGVASALEDVIFALSNADEVRAKYGVAAGAETVVVVRDFTGEERVVTYTGGMSDAKSVTAFIEESSLPLVIAFSPDNAPKIFRGTIKTHFLLFADDKAEGYDKLVADFRTVAVTGKGKALFVTVDPSQDRVIGYFGVTAADMPTAVIVSMPEGEAMKKFSFPKELALDAAGFGAFLGDYTSGKLKPFLKSEPAPSEAAEAEAPVKTIVGTTFDKLVLDPSKDVLLEFYAPWCGHCKQLAPEFEKVGKQFKSAGAAAASVVIAKMDATANEVDYPGVNVRGFPTILLFPASKDGSPKRVVEYDGSRDAPGFVSFMRKNAVEAFKLPNEEEMEL